MSPNEIPPPEEKDADRLLLHTAYDGAGALLRTWLVRDGAGVGLWDEDAAEAQALPPGALAAVFRRYGRPLDQDAEGVRGPGGAALAVPCAPVGGPAMLRCLRFVPFGYLQPLDYLIWEPAAGEPLCAPAPLVTAALRKLAAAAGP